MYLTGSSSLAYFLECIQSRCRRDQSQKAVVFYSRHCRHEHFKPKKEQAMNFTIEIRVKPEKFHELYQTLQALLPTMRAEHGCRVSRIYRDVEDGEVFFLAINWDDAANLKHYMRSTSGSALLGAVDLLSKSVRVRMGGDSPWDGIEVLKRMRTGT